MDFDSLDSYLLDGSPAKAHVVKELLENRSGPAEAAAFYQGIAMLGKNTPDLTLLALRLVLAGKKADDTSVIRLRRLAERARAKGGDRESAVEAYRRELQ